MEQEAKMDREELNLNSEVVITDITLEYKFFKRVIDVVCSLAGLLLLSPVLIIVSILIKLESDGPIIFSQDRIGYNGQKFKMYKFRSMVVLPSDHLIEKEDVFLNIIKKSTEFLNDYKNSIITLGMTPNRAETGYGYIEVGSDEISSSDFTISNVSRFVEKPNKEKAEEYLQAGNFLWNGGMFMWKVESILEKIKEYMPRTYNALIGLEEVSEIELNKFVNENYKETEAISVDYGILEKSKEIFVVPSDIGWDDIGSWDAMERYREKDEQGNVVIGESKKINAKNNIIVSSGKKIVIADLEDIYVLESEKSIIVGRKSNINNLKNIKESVGL